MSIAIGMILGICAATFQSLSYLGSRMFVNRYHSPVLLLAVSHVIMGLVSIIALPFIIPDDMPALKEYFWPLVGSAGFYLLGQVCLFKALITSDASRMSPLLGLKVLILASIGTLFFNQNYHPVQWVAVACSVIAAFILSWAGGKISYRSLVWIIIACFPYCGSDANIKLLVTQFDHLSKMHSSILSTCLCYILCGIVGIALLAFQKKTSVRMWLDACPFSAAWFTSMLFLFATFASIGVVFGNIMQSTRGIISILLGYAIAHLGFVSLEQKISRQTLYYRIIAAIFMSIAIWMFYKGS